MVQKYQSPVRVYKHPFELIMAVSTPCLSLLWLLFKIKRGWSANPLLCYHCFLCSAVSVFVTCAQILLWFLKYEPLKLQICMFVLLHCFWGDGWELSSFSLGEHRSGILTQHFLWILLFFLCSSSCGQGVWFLPCHACLGENSGPEGSLRIEYCVMEFSPRVSKQYCYVSFFTK